MSALQKYYLMPLLLLFHSLSSNEALQQLATNGGDFIFLVTGGQRLMDTHQYTRFMVSLRERTATHHFGDNHYCAGIIIADQWILTAASCAVQKTRVLRLSRTIIVVTGTPNRVKEFKSTRLMAVKKVFVHSSFILNTTNDIAMLRLKDKIQLDENTQVMPLPTQPPPYGTRCTVLGWGRLYAGGPYATIVSHVDLLLYSAEQCMQRHPKYAPGDLCAGSNIDFYHGPCPGDGGGPLICNNTLVGIVSRTIGCGSNKYPSLYTDVYENLDFIEGAMFFGGAHLWTRMESDILLLVCFLIVFN